ncbi:hydrogen gas-evolving membrane-bound hydrogenase subunit E [Kaistia terrae]|uniref:Hydrogen gas-evolving membrane-bound hydrogenase subunit E n=1 Tax=Kaistia terrae TaxID=537017 RepID=A0ABW0PPT4_9HYPH|nr:hydrogen gas-evolving membrane-bound hydrogenase subunit E [Kaistia terrae]MCX5577864.1 sodium:proton antiporter [Kaistia terrae]
MMRHILVAVIVVLFGLIFARMVGGYVELDALRPLALDYVTRAPVELGTPNIITGILITYRGFDTLGEVAVLFMVAASVGLLLKKDDAKPASAKVSSPKVSGEKTAAAKPVLAKTEAARAAAARSAAAKANASARAATAGSVAVKSTKEAAPAEDDEAAPREASEIVRTGTEILLPLIFTFGAYVIVNGHLSAGGGFQGGAVVASGVMLMLLARPGSTLNVALLSIIESFAGVFYVGLGILGLVLAGGFLDPRFLPKGEFGAFISAGAIPLISALLGIKVGAELSVIIDRFRS